MGKLVLALVWLLASTVAAAAIDCSSRPILYGSWRLIDGKRCWHHGTRKVDKDNLRWVRIVKKREPRRATLISPRRQRQSESEHAYRPPVVKPTFDERFYFPTQE